MHEGGRTVRKGDGNVEAESQKELLAEESNLQKLEGHGRRFSPTASTKNAALSTP